jgi:hypothetical protein
MKDTTPVHTKHSMVRAQQRCISQQMIEDAVSHGRLIRKQGLRYYVVTEKSICYLHENHYKDRLKNTVVILNADNSILTVYKNSKAFHHIKKKPKMYYR